MLGESYNGHMLRKLSALAVCVAVTATCCKALEQWHVRLTSFGPVRFGVRLRDLNRTLHTSYSKPTDPEADADCFYVDVPGHSGTELMILNGRVGRVDVNDPATPTASGIRVGDPESRAVEVYGRGLEVEPHHYIPEDGHYLTLLSRDRKFGIRFETEDGKITSYYAGTVEAISYIEGCS